MISQGDLATQHAEAVLDSAVIARADVSVIDLRGPRAVECAQGITTNDVAGAGDGSFIYGAILTPKGMIISDLWSVRDNDTVSLIIPAPATESVSSVLRKSIPPRLARINDLSDETVVFRLVGPRALEVASSAGFHIPDSGHTVWCVVDSSKCLVNRPTDPAPFALQLNVPVHDAAQVSKHLQQSGAEPGPDTALELARILAGWPRLGSEIGEKTLPQGWGAKLEKRRCPRKSDSMTSMVCHIRKGAIRARKRLPVSTFGDMQTGGSSVSLGMTSRSSR